MKKITRVKYLVKKAWVILSPVFFILLFANLSYAAFTVSAISASSINLISGQSLNLDFTYNSDQANRQIGYFVAFSTQCALKPAGAGQDIIVGDAGINVLSAGGQVSGGRQRGCATQCAVATNYQISGIEGGQLAITIPLNYPTGTYYIIVGVQDWNVYMNPSIQVDSQTCLMINVTAPTPTVTRTLTPTPTGVQNVGRSPFGMTNYVAYILGVSTPSNTPTLTPTPTFTNTSTKTFTPTVTVTFTPTSSNTATPTYTNTMTTTYTATSTRTVTPTQTPSVTDTISSNTPTSTRTFTPTPTVTPTWSDTVTPTDTGTNTYTYTATSTATATPTQSYTGTFTPTFTVTPTGTPTYTQTYTYTNSPVFTATITRTATDTYTATPTYTSTPTETQSNTYTQTRTPSSTPTITNTYTQTYTVTVTLTVTFTDTYTPTRTATSSFTDTPTATLSPTITATLPPYPYVFEIAAYNSAGEKVKLIANSLINRNLTGVSALANGADGGVFNPKKGPLTIRISGVNTPEQSGNSYSDFNWDGTSDNGQDIAPGIYYIKLTTQDTYGHTDTMIKEVSLFRSRETVKLSIYNSAGEIVRVLQSADLPLDKISLQVEDVLKVGDPGDNMTVTYGGLLPFVWDGKNSSGLAVGSGVYELVLEVVNEAGIKTTMTRPVNILSRRNKSAFTGEKVYPNPCYIGENTFQSARALWTALATGKMEIAIYNIQGELIKNLSAALSDGHADWDIKTNSGVPVSSGLYVFVMKARTDAGEVVVKTVKLAVVNRFNSDSDVVN